MNEQEWLASDDPVRMLHQLAHWSFSPAYGATGRDVRLSDRQLRLFACGVCRLAWSALTDPRGRAAVEVAERYADGLATAREMADAGDEADAPDAEHGWFETPFWAARATTLAGARDAANVAVDYSGVPPAAQAAILRCVLGNPFRPASLCGLPYCAGSAAPGASCAECRRLREAPDVRALARAAYEARQGPCRRCKGRADWDWHDVLTGDGRCYDCRGRSSEGFLDGARLAVLADPLEEAGCPSEVLLRHLRGEGPAVNVTLSGPRRPVVLPGQWRPLPGPHARGCWAVDLALGRG